LLESTQTESWERRVRVEPHRRRRFRLLNERRVTLLIAALALLALRAFFLPPSLEDLDSVNFDLGVHDFDPLRHQPHPPGYPVFIAVAKIAHSLWPDHASALALVSALFGAFTVFPLYSLLRVLVTPGAAVLACVLTLFCPLVWFNSVRPMSDTTGFFFVLAAQAAVVRLLCSTSPGSSEHRTAWIAGVLVGIAMGVRSQAIFLVGPLLVLTIVLRRTAALRLILGTTAGVLVWAIPLVVSSGGIMPLLRSFLQLVEDALPSEPLVKRFTLARAYDSALHVFVEPWNSLAVARAVLIASAVGFTMLLLRARRSLIIAAVLFVPYLAYHYLLQMTETIRYAIPTIPLIALGAATAVDRLCDLMLGSKTTVAVALMVYLGLQTYPALEAFHRTLSPPAQAIEFLRLQDTGARRIHVAGNFVFTRYLQRLSERFTVMYARPMMARYALNEYWKGGGEEPILFLKDRQRTMTFFFASDGVQLLQRWQWPAAVRPLMMGERPGEIDLVRLDPPSWFSESGFMLSAEAGTPDVVARQPHALYIHRSSAQHLLSVTGSVVSQATVDVDVRVGGRVQERVTVAGTFKVQTRLRTDESPGPYLPVVLNAGAPLLLTGVAVEPIDRAALHLRHGFFLPERDEQRIAYRWMGRRARAEVFLPNGRGRVRLRGRVPVEHFEQPVILRTTWNGRPLAAIRIDDTDLDVELELKGSANKAWNTLDLESSHTFVPSRVEGTDDHRELAVRIYALDLEEL
jgi:hypothetical protein